MNDLIITSLKKDELKSLIEESIRTVLSEKPEKSSSSDANNFLNVEEASVFLNLAKATLYSLSSTSKIPVIKKGKRLYFSKQSLIDWLNLGRRKTVDEIQLESEQYLINGRNKSFHYMK
jgi:hypothetical protein